MQDYLDEVGDTEIKSILMKGGIKGWQQTLGGKFMDSYDEQAWKDKAQ